MAAWTHHAQINPLPWDRKSNEAGHLRANRETPPAPSTLPKWRQRTRQGLRAGCLSCYELLNCQSSFCISFLHVHILPTLWTPCKCHLFQKAYADFSSLRWSLLNSIILYLYLSNSSALPLNLVLSPLSLLPCMWRQRPSSSLLLLLVPPTSGMEL